jgi:uncharacterized protein
MSAGTSAVADLRATFGELPGVDQHAHPLSGPGREWGLADLLSESAEPGQRAQICHHPAHRRALRDLGAVLGVDADEDAIAVARRDAGYEQHTRRLLDAGRFEAMLVDDGFPVAEALDLEAQAALAGCPVYRVLRIETVAERAARNWPAFTVVRDRFREAVTEALDGGTAALKTIAAYRCGLDLPRPEFSDAEQAYGAWRRTSPGDGERTRLAHPALIAFFLSEALAVARDRRPVPLQVHTGLGDADLALQRADPALLGPVIAEAAAARIPVVLLHCYPFVRQAAWLASIHGHVFVDLSLALLLAGHRGADIVLDALDLAPASKVLFATDASRAAEMFFLAARWWRDALAGAFGRLVADDALDAATARRWGEWILMGNARRLYSL